MPTAVIVDAVVFFGFIFFVIFFGIWKARKKKGSGENSESYFLAGRGLNWWLIGFSLIAANISTEQFVGMSGSAARPEGLAIAGYEWLAAVTLVIVAFFFLPTFLRCGIYTIPEFLERRYGQGARLIMSLLMVIVLVCVNVTCVIFSGAKMLDISLGNTMNIVIACWLVGGVSAIYVMCGGLKACAWADLLQGTALILGGAIILVLALIAFDAAPPDLIAGDPATGSQISDMSLLEKFKTVNGDRLHTIRPVTCKAVPWTALLIGLWIPNLYYWGLNQYIMQRTLGAKSLAHGQGGAVFAAALKLLIPFIVIFPGMMALNLFMDDRLGYEDNMQSEAKLKSNMYPVISFETASGIDLPSFDSAQMKKDEPVNFELARKEADRSIAFKFNDDFVSLYPEDAALVSAFNEKVYGQFGGTKEKIDAQFEALLESAKKDAKIDKDWRLSDGTIGETQQVRLRNQAILDLIESEHNEQLTGTGLVKMVHQIRAFFTGENPELVVVQKELVGYDYDAAFPLLVNNLVRTSKNGVIPGLNGFILAAMMGAVMSSLASMLNAAATIFSMDLVKRYLYRGISEWGLVLLGRVLTIAFVIVGCSLAPFLADPRFGGVFAFIQEFQGYISPGILAIFLFGLFARKAPAVCGIVGLLLNPVIYGLLMFLRPDFAFLDRMAITFGIIFVVLATLRLLFPRKTPYEFEMNTTIEMKPSRIAQAAGIFILLTVAGLYYFLR
ncbi:MAG TPA: hypothetical protein DEB39_13635 [Planctomycetaceae bacterium]|nr:hypothetical protein [Planctomycetaceae bacterium]